MNIHEQAREQISMLLDGALSPKEETALRAHLAECPDCAAFYDAFSALSSFVGDDLDEPPETLRVNVMAELRRADIRKRSLRSREWIGFAAVAAVLALVVMVGPALRRSDTAAVSETKYQAAAGMVGRTYEAAESDAAFEAAMPYAFEAAEEEYEEAVEAPAANRAPVVVTSEDAMAAEDGALPTEEYAAAPMFDMAAEEAEELVSMDALLRLLGGTPTELDLDAAALSPVFLIETDGGVLALYRCGDGLYYRDPSSGETREAQCSEVVLLAFLQS